MFDLILDISKYSFIQSGKGIILDVEQYQCITDDTYIYLYKDKTGIIQAIETVDKEIIIDSEWFNLLNTDQKQRISKGFNSRFKLGTFNIIETSQAKPAWQELL